MNGIQENQKCEYVQNASRRIGIKQRGNDKPRAKHDSFILETLTVKRISVDKNNGIVISHCGKNKILKQYINDRGYCRITISMNNFPITVFVHRVVWISEYGVPQDPFLQINHIDNNPSNDRHQPLVGWMELVI